MEKGETMPEEIQEKAAPIVEKEEVKVSADPFDSWDDIFPELAVKAEEDEQNPTEDPAKADGLTEDNVRMIVREEIKKWVKGVTDGKYPFPKGTTASEPTKYPYPSKEEMEAMSSGIQKSLDDKLAQLMTQISKIDIIEKSLVDIKSENEALRKDVEIIRDQPAQIIEKSIDVTKKRKGFKSTYKVKEDGTIEFQ